MSHTTSATAARLIVIASVTLGVASGAIGADLADLNEVLRNWRRREDSYRSAFFAWKIIHGCPRGVWSSDPIVANPNKEVFPPTDMSFEENASLTVSGSKIRFATSYFIWDHQRKIPCRMSYDFAFDGTKSSRRFDRDGARFQDGNVLNPNEGNNEAGNYHLAPVLLSVCPLKQKLFHTNKPARCEVGTLEGDPCLILSQDASGPEQQVRLYIKPQQDYAVSRVLMTYKEMTTLQIDTRFSRQPTGAWHPAAWDIAWRPATPLAETFQGTVTESRFGETVPENAFAIQFAPGTLIEDRTDERTRNYIVRENGPPRDIQPHEMTAKYEQLVNTESGDAFEHRGFRPIRFWVILVVVALGTTGIWLIWRRR